MIAGSGIAVATFRDHVHFLQKGEITSFHDIWLYAVYIVAAFTVIYFLYLLATNLGTDSLSFFLAFVLGSVASFGLLIAGVCRISKVEGVLTMDNHWDPTLLFFYGTAMIFNLITFSFVSGGEPTYADDFEPINESLFDFPVIVGSVLFGVGWAISGLCPGPALLNFFNLFYTSFWMLGYILGWAVHEKLLGGLKK